MQPQRARRVDEKAGHVTSAARIIHSGPGGGRHQRPPGFFPGAARRNEAAERAETHTPRRTARRRRLTRRPRCPPGAGLTGRRPAGRRPAGRRPAGRRPPVGGPPVGPTGGDQKSAGRRGGQIDKEEGKPPTHRAIKKVFAAALVLCEERSPPPVLTARGGAIHELSGAFNRRPLYFRAIGPGDKIADAFAIA